MKAATLETLGLNKNEAKVYYALLTRGSASAQEIIKALGVYRNVVYDNLEKLIQKGLVSVTNNGKKKIFIAENPKAITEYLEKKQETLAEELRHATSIIPQITTLLGSAKTKQEVTLFKGITGLKQVLAEIVEAKQSWCIGITNESVDLLGETYWKNYNKKKKAYKTEEWLLWNHDFKNTVIGKNKKSHHRVLPPELNQVTESIMYNNKVAILVFTTEPIVMVLENKHVFDSFRKQFEFLWSLSEKTYP